MGAFFLITLILFLPVMLKCFLESYKSGKDYKTALVSTSVFAFAAQIANLIIIYSPNGFVCTIGYELFFISIDWILFFFLIFCRKYTGYRVKLPWLDIVLFFAVVLDSVSIGLNVVSGHIFSLDFVRTAGSASRITKEIPYIIHLCLCYLLVVLSFICLVEKCMTAPRIYRIKYTLPLASFAIPVAVDAVYVFSDFSVNYSVFSYVLALLCLFFFSYKYIPRNFLTSSLSLVVQNMTDPVLFFDENFNCVYKNEAYEKFLEFYNKKGLYPEKFFLEWIDSIKKHPLKSGAIDNQSFNHEVGCDGETYYFSILFKILRDEKRRIMGVFIQIHDRTVEENSIQHQKYIATYDVLTGVYNKATFFSIVEEYMRFHADEKYCMVCTDIDNFKLINDVFGTSTGDKFLISIAREIRLSLKPTDIIGRLGGDNFAILLKKSDFNEDVIVSIMKRLSRIDSGKIYPVVFHVGIYEIDDVHIPVSVMCDRACMALETVKNNLTERFAYYTSSLRDKMIMEQNLVGGFSSALESGQFRIYLQPQIRADGECRGAEALARWVHPERGVINPKEFIPLFERNGIITKLDKYIWELAAERLEIWKKCGREDMYISVNISPKDLYYVDIYKEFSSLVKKYGIKSSNLHLEITESALLVNFQTQLERIKKLRDAGFSVEMDDFGSGYSSFNMLKDVKFDVIKIDMEFLRRTENEVRSKKILENIVNLAKILEMPVVIEGVETEDQSEYLRSIGCDIFQGFYFDRPLEISCFEEKYIKPRISAG